MKQKPINKMVTSAMLLALGIVLPFLTMQIKEIGDTLLPMHMPVMLCGLVCGPVYGLAVGFILPVLRSLMFSMPPLYPVAVSMAFEMGTYGLVLGLMYRGANKGKLWYLYTCLITAMLSGRIVWGVAKTILMGMAGKPFTMEMFIVGGFTDAYPGIILQLVLVPVIIKLIEKIQSRRN